MGIIVTVSGRMPATVFNGDSDNCVQSILETAPAISAIAGKMGRCAIYITRTTYVMQMAVVPPEHADMDDVALWRADSEAGWAGWHRAFWGTEPHGLEVTIEGGAHADVDALFGHLNLNRPRQPHPTDVTVQWVALTVDFAPTVAPDLARQITEAAAADALHTDALAHGITVVVTDASSEENVIIRIHGFAHFPLDFQSDVAETAIGDSVTQAIAKLDPTAWAFCHIHP